MKELLNKPLPALLADILEKLNHPAVNINEFSKYLCESGIILTEPSNGANFALLL